MLYQLTIVIVISIHFYSKYTILHFFIAKKYHIPVISLAGYLGQGIDQLYDEGFTAIFGILAKAESIEQALKDGPINVTRTTENIVRLIAQK